MEGKKKFLGGICQFTFQVPKKQNFHSTKKTLEMITLYFICPPSNVLHASPTTIFHKFGFLLAFWISFFHLFDNFIHAHLHNIFHKLLDIHISQSFCLSLVYDKGSFGYNVVHFNIFSSCCSNPPYFFFSSFTNDMHIVSHISNVVFFFLQFYAKFVALGLSIQLVMFIAWSPQELNPPIRFFYT